MQRLRSCLLQGRLRGETSFPSFHTSTVSDPIVCNRYRSTSGLVRTVQVRNASELGEYSRISDSLAGGNHSNPHYLIHPRSILHTRRKKSNRVAKVSLS